MKRKRLKKLEQLLLEDAKRKKGVKFDMKCWARPADPALFGNSEPETIYYNSDQIIPDVSCNTYACALGLAAISGVFKRQGLTYKLEPYYVQLVSDTIRIQNGKSVGYRLTPVYDKKREFDAGESFFGLNWDEVGWLFDSYYYYDDETEGAVAEKKVAKRIRYLIDHGELPKEANQRGLFSDKQYDRQENVTND